MSTPAQELAHRNAIAAAESTRQTDIAAAKAGYNNTPATYPAYAAAVKAADVAHVRAIITSAVANGFDGPRQTLHDLTGSWG